MTTFTLKDYIDNMTKEDMENLSGILDELEKRKSQDASITVEPIPFAGYVNLQDVEDTEAMLRKQIDIIGEELNTLKAENQRLKRKLRALGENE